MVPRFATLGRIPKGVWVLGGVSLLMDVSSEMITASYRCLWPLPSARRQRDNYRSYRGLASHRPDPEDFSARSAICRQA